MLVSHSLIFASLLAENLYLLSVPLFYVHMQLFERFGQILVVERG